MPQSVSDGRRFIRRVRRGESLGLLSHVRAVRARRAAHVGVETRCVGVDGGVQRVFNRHKRVVGVGGGIVPAIAVGVHDAGNGAGSVRRVVDRRVESLEVCRGPEDIGDD